MELQVDITQLEIKLYNPFTKMTYKYYTMHFMSDCYFSVLLLTKLPYKTPKYRKDSRLHRLNSFHCDFNYLSVRSIIDALYLLDSYAISDYDETSRRLVLISKLSFIILLWLVWGTVFCSRLFTKGHLKRFWHCVYSGIESSPDNVVSSARYTTSEVYLYTTGKIKNYPHKLVKVERPQFILRSMELLNNNLGNRWLAIGRIVVVDNFYLMNSIRDPSRMKFSYRLSHDPHNCHFHLFTRLEHTLLR